MLADRPRERLDRCGPAPLADVELLALVLGTGSRGRSALSVAGDLVARFPDLRRMAHAGLAELAEVVGVGEAKAYRVKAALALAGRLVERPFLRGDPLCGPGEVYERVGRRIAQEDREVFVGLALDVRNRVQAELKLAEGGVCSVEIIVRDVFCRLMREAAVGVVFVHNHPSGDPMPSGADEQLTERMCRAGDLVGVRVLDHVIAATSGFRAFSTGWR